MTTPWRAHDPSDVLPALCRGGRLRRALRIAWAAPCTAVGLLAAAPALLFGGQLARVDHTLEVALTRAGRPRRWVRWLPFDAITFGHLIVAVDAAALVRLRTHERVHVAQYERWGACFFVAYPLASGVAWLRGGRAYADNRFEVQARAGARDTAA